MEREVVHNDLPVNKYLTGVGVWAVGFGYLGLGFGGLGFRV